jgi:hypothetical protein
MSYCFDKVPVGMRAVPGWPKMSPTCPSQKQNCFYLYIGIRSIAIALQKNKTMKRSELYPLPEYFDRYINQNDDVDIPTAIQTSMDELQSAPLEKWKALGDRVYAPGKWTVKDTLQHLIDTERIFSYRALAFARGEKAAMPSFSEDEYATEARANNRSLEELVAELQNVHAALKSLYTGFTREMLERKGMGFKGLYSVADIGFMMPGHQRWHFNILAERYYPLLDI